MKVETINGGDVGGNNSGDDVDNDSVGDDVDNNDGGGDGGDELWV